MKETLFAILGERVPDARVLDLYAGSGAVGIEALSRGAASVRLRRARHGPRSRRIRANLASDPPDGRGARARACRVERYLAGGTDGPWDLVVLDPPYEERAIVAPLRAVVPHLAPGATVVVISLLAHAVPAVEGLTAVRERRFGETMLSFLETEGA